jgi:MFS family permease
LVLPQTTAHFNGFATNVVFQDYWSFLVFRAMIGFGESGFTTLAPTVLGDLFEGPSRTICLALFYYAIPVGR